MEQGEEFDSHTLKRMMHHNPGPEYLEDYEHFRKEYLLPLESLEA
jgi:phosphate:Na+ symporter